MSHLCLVSATRERDDAKIRKLVNDGLNVDSIYGDNPPHLDDMDEGYNPLMTAASLGCVDMARLLLDLGANVHATNHFDFTALHVAAMMGHLPIVKLLLENNAYPNVFDYQEWSPLFYACSQGHVEIIKCLIENGAWVDMYADDGRSCFHVLRDCTDLSLDVQEELKEYSKSTRGLMREY